MKNKNRKLIEIFCFIAVGIIFLVNLLELNYDNLSWKENSGAYWSIISVSFIFLSFVFNSKKENEVKNNRNCR
ncbi:hypothetical protein [uncultured Polaribacter sp.]|uniref:hypothetical protein n=1 Tax=uncultured Polaribacter sp. TaxID=174711 RepID=UPI00260FE13F|nr:hypothetical protein [uncultured Polaribacter sp.]